MKLIIVKPYDFAHARNKAVVLMRSMWFDLQFHL